MTTRSKCAVWLVVVFVSGAVIGSGLCHFLGPDNATGQAAFNQAQIPQNVVNQIAQIVDQCEPNRTFSSENDFGDWLSDYLRQHSDYEIETRPSSPVPDILVENTLAIELKINPNKSERDRCVSQCVRYVYQQQWDTIVVLLDTPPSEVRDLDTLLDLVGLEEVPVFELRTGDHE